MQRRPFAYDKENDRIAEDRKETTPLSQFGGEVMSTKR
jgi:hypothetical protein